MHFDIYSRSPSEGEMQVHAADRRRNDDDVDIFLCTSDLWNMWTVKFTQNPSKFNFKCLSDEYPDCREKVYY